MRHRFRRFDLLVVIALIALGAAFSDPSRVLCIETRQVRPPGLEPCWASLEGDRLVLGFHNPSSKQLILQVGRGLPPCRLERDELMVFVPQFGCPLEHEHDCFHADSLKLPPGGSAELSYPASQVEGLTGAFRQQLRQGGLACWYRSPPLSPEQADGSVPAAVEDGRVVLSFHNPGLAPRQVRIGRGQPEYLFQPGEKPVLMASYTCPAQYVHDCDHYELLEVGPGETRQVVLQTPPSGELRSQLELTGSCWYISRTPQESS